MANKNILFIDDDEEILNLVSTKLSQSFSVFVAPTVVEAIEIFKKDNIDCIVCDISMPGVTGFDLLYAFNETKSNFPFIVYTAKGNEYCKEDMIKNGADAFILKPDLETLKAEAIKLTSKQVDKFTEVEIDKLVNAIVLF